MQRRGLSAVLLVAFMWGGMTATAMAASTAPTPGPSINPPPLCFVMKSNALPTCEQNPDGTWTAIYPNGTRTTGSGSGSGSTGSSGGSNTDRNVGIVVLVAALLGIAVIVWRTWLRPKSASPDMIGSQAPLGTAKAAPGDAGLNVSYTAPPIVQQPPPVAAPPVPAPAPAASAAQRLAELNALHNQGAISPEEFEARRQAILNET